MTLFDKEALLTHLSQILDLLKLAGENPFKVRAFEKALGVVEGANDLASRIRKKTLEELPGIGKGISATIEAWANGEGDAALQELRKKIPAGLEELTKVSGLGPKKAMTLIEEFGIRTLSELEYACRENRLLGIPGFGEKLQAKILEGLLFLRSTSGKLTIEDALKHEVEILGALKKALGSKIRVESTGELRRRLEIVQELSFLVGTEKNSDKSKAEKVIADFRKALHQIRIELIFTAPGYFEWEWAKSTGDSEHWKALGQPSKTEEDEAAIYKTKKLPWISPELREGTESIELARSHGLDDLLGEEHAVQGVFHNHTTRSDGSATLEEMVSRAESLGFKYIGISDHSASAAYAHGLRAADLEAQFKEVEACRKKHKKIRIFWGIESDILQDGSLDYPESQLKKFDFVIGSIHQRFQMDKEQMTKRIVNAIRNPYTRFIGHLTGRLLLGRPPYELDLKTIAKEAAKHDVAIELNSHPSRLDIDWRYGALFREHGVKTSVNPDAHSLSDLENIRYGTWMARKALFPRSLIINSWNVDQVEKWLARKH